LEPPINAGKNFFIFCVTIFIDNRFKKWKVRGGIRLLTGKKRFGWGFGSNKEETHGQRVIPQDPALLFASYYDEYFEKVNRYLRYRIGNYWDADDVTAAVFTKAFESCRRDGMADHFGPWIFRIAHNAYVDYLRKKGRAKMSVQELDINLSDGIWQTEAEVMAQENVRILHERLSLLPEDYRDVVTMKYIAELKTSEIAQVLDKSEGAVKTLLYRAVRKLRSIYEEAERREWNEE
jgi:RNA polymerase sigma factor (sigma-70 family)